MAFFIFLFCPIFFIFPFLFFCWYSAISIGIPQLNHLKCCPKVPYNRSSNRSRNQTGRAKPACSSSSVHSYRRPAHHSFFFLLPALIRSGLILRPLLLAHRVIRFAHRGPSDPGGPKAHNRSFVIRYRTDHIYLFHDLIRSLRSLLDRGSSYWAFGPGWPPLVVTRHIGLFATLIGATKELWSNDPKDHSPHSFGRLRRPVRFLTKHKPINFIISYDDLIILLRKTGWRSAQTHIVK